MIKAILLSLLISTQAFSMPQQAPIYWGPGNAATIIPPTLNVGTLAVTTAITNSSTTDSTSSTTGALTTAGGLGVAKAVNIGTTLGVNGATTLNDLLTLRKGTTFGLTIGNVTSNSGSIARFLGTNAGYNWFLDNNITAAGLSFVPSTAAGGSTEDVTPLLFLGGASANRIGIGTGSPAHTLDVVGDFSTSGAASVTGLFTATKGSTFGVTIGDVSTNSNSVLRMQGTSAGKNWQIANNLNFGGLEFTPSTANGGTTYTTPTLTLAPSAVVVTGTLGVTGVLTASSTLKLGDSQVTTGQIYVDANGTGTAQSIAGTGGGTTGGGTADFPAGSTSPQGLLFVDNRTTGKCALVMVTIAGTTILSDPSSIYSNTAGTASKDNVYLNSTNIRIEHNSHTSTADSFTLLWIRTGT